MLLWPQKEDFNGEEIAVSAPKIPSKNVKWVHLCGLSVTK